MDSKPRVLIVDDSKVVRATIAKIIRDSFDTRQEADGEAGWAAIESDQDIVAVISDLSMPKLDGIGLLQRIRGASSPRVRDLPFLVISGNEDDDTRAKARTAGANDFISKSTRPIEAVGRIDNLLRLAQAKRDLEASHLALKLDDDEKMWDPVTGAFTAAYLLTEAGKHFSHARRHSTALSVISFRIENYAELEKKLGKPTAGQLLARIVKLVQGTLRAEDSMGRMAEALFTVVSPSTAAEQAIAFARRLRERLDSAKISHGAETIRIRTNLGVSSFVQDKPASMEDLLKVAMDRLERAAAKPVSEQPDMTQNLAATLQRAVQNDLSLAVQMLEKASVERYAEVMDKLGPLIKVNCQRLGIELQEYFNLLQAKQP
jgi:two-component system, cell cycle response regulator